MCRRKTIPWLVTVFVSTLCVEAAAQDQDTDPAAGESSPEAEDGSQQDHEAKAPGEPVEEPDEAAREIPESQAQDGQIPDPEEQPEEQVQKPVSPEGRPFEQDDPSPLQKETAAAPPDEPPRSIQPEQPGAPSGADPDALEVVERHPFSRGDMELGLGLAASGYGDYFYFGISGLFAYYVLDRLAPGIDISYTHIFADEYYYEGSVKMKSDYPDSLLLLPLVKYVIIQSRSFAPYVIAAFGREFEWGADRAVGGWTAGGGAGIHIGLGEHFNIKIQLVALHYWYDETKVFGYDDEDLYTDESGSTYLFHPDNTGEQGIVLYDSKGNQYICPDEVYCPKVNDTEDTDTKWFFPLLSLGFAYVF